MNESGNIGYQILGEIRLKKGSLNFDIPLELSNPTDRNFILYGFKRSTFLLMSDSSLCAKPQGAGNALFIIDSLGNEMPEKFSLDMHRYDYLEKPVTEDSLYRVLKKVRSEYTDGKEVLKSGQRKLVTLNVDMKSNPPIQQLKPGEYLIYLIYYAGDDLTKVIEGSPIEISLIEETTIKADEKKYNATVFKGWIRSNKIRLVVE